MTIKADHYNLQVDAQTEETKDYTVPDGKTLLVKKFRGEACFDSLGTSSIVWDKSGVNEVIDLTNGSKRNDNLSYSCVGNGTKKISIVLLNDDQSPRMLGASWEGTEEDTPA